MAKNNTVNVPSCYIDQVTSRQACNYVVPKSGRHIELLPGLSASSAAQIAEAKNSNGNDLIYDKSIMAVQLLETQLQQSLAYWGYMLPTAPKTRDFCDFNSTQTNATFPDERGVKIVQNNLESPFSSIYLENIYIKVKTGGMMDILVKDKLGNTLHTFTENIPANEFTVVAANVAIFESEVYVVVDNTLIETYRTTCHSGTCCSNNYNLKASKFFHVSGWNGQSSTREGYGLGVKVGIKCDIQTLMCDVLPLIPNAVLYQTGIEILEELRASNRLSIVTLSEQDWVEEVMPRWQARVNEEMKVLTPTFLEQLRAKDTHCVVCKKGNVRVVSNV